MPHARPIWGFGWIGWTAIATLLGLIVAILAGVDLTILHANLIHDLFGLDFLFWYWQRVLVGHYLSFLSPMFGMVAAAATVLALFLYPDRAGWWRYAMIIGWGLIRPALYGYGITFTVWLFWKVTGTTISQITALYIFPFLAESGTCTILGIATQSWKVALCAIAAVVVTIALPSLVEIWIQSELSNVLYLLAMFAFNGIIGAGVIWWSLSARREWLNRYAVCVACGYDLRGVAHERCPECGESVVTANPAPA